MFRKNCYECKNNVFPMLRCMLISKTCNSGCEIRNPFKSLPHHTDYLCH